MHVILINSTAGCRTTFPRIVIIHDVFESLCVFFRVLVLRRYKAGRGNWVFDGLGEVIGGFELISSGDIAFRFFDRFVKSNKFFSRVFD